MLRGMPETARYNRTLARLRRIAVFLFLGLLVILAQPTPWSVSAGFIVIFVGEAIRIWAAGHLYKTVELVTSGPYRFTRNPLYLGRLLIFSGICVMARLPWRMNLLILGLGYLVFFAYYLPRKERVERTRLRQLHGRRFEQYEQLVPALVPTRRPYPEGLSRGWSSLRMSRNREHWMVLALIALTALLLWVAYIEPRGLLIGWIERS